MLVFLGIDQKSAGLLADDRPEERDNVSSARPLRRVVAPELRLVPTPPRAVEDKPSLSREVLEKEDEKLRSMRANPSLSTDKPLLSGEKLALGANKPSFVATNLRSMRTNLSLSTDKPLPSGDKLDLDANKLSFVATNVREERKSLGLVRDIPSLTEKKPAFPRPNPSVVREKLSVLRTRLRVARNNLAAVRLRLGTEPANREGIDYLSRSRSRSFTESRSINASDRRSRRTIGD